MSKRDEVLKGIVKKLVRGLRSSPEMQRKRRELADEVALKQVRDYLAARDIIIYNHPHPHQRRGYDNSGRDYRT